MTTTYEAVREARGPWAADAWYRAVQSLEETGDTGPSFQALSPSEFGGGWEAYLENPSGYIRIYRSAADAERDCDACNATHRGWGHYAVVYRQFAKEFLEVRNA